MAEPILTSHSLKPAFELEDFMNFARETRISSAALENLVNLWENWQDKLQISQIQEGKSSWLAIWLPEEVEKLIDDAWEKSPSEGFLINSLAQYMCMAAVEELLPQAANGGCAPAPMPTPSLIQSLDKLGIGEPDKNDLSILRRYGIVTYYPFRGGCEICSLAEHCPKANGAGEGFANVVLPGYERGND